MTAHPIRIQLSRAKGWRIPADTVKVDRSTCWGNPFRVGKPIDMKMAREWGWKIHFPAWCAEDAQQAVRKFGACLAADEAVHYGLREALAGKNLACWCPIGSPCHADVLLEIANAGGPS